MITTPQEAYTIEECQSIPLELPVQRSVRIENTNRIIDAVIMHFYFKYDWGFKVTREMLESKSRKREIVIVRHSCIFFLKQYYGTGMPLKRLGSIFGGRDHSTAIHALNAVSDAYQTDPQYRADVDRIGQSLDIRIKW